MVTSSTLPHSGLNKRWNALSYHSVREAVASKMVRFYHIKGEHNPADVLSKHVGFPEMWRSIKSLLFWQGDTTKCLTKEEYQVMKMSPHGNLGNSVQGEYQDAKSEEKNNPTGSEVSTPKDSRTTLSNDQAFDERHNGPERCPCMSLVSLPSLGLCHHQLLGHRIPWLENPSRSIDRQHT